MGPSGKLILYQLSSSTSTRERQRSRTRGTQHYFISRKFLFRTCTNILARGCQLPRPQAGRRILVRPLASKPTDKVWVRDGPVGRAKSCIGSRLDWWRWSLCVPLHLLLHVGPANVLVSLFVGLAWPSF